MIEVFVDTVTLLRCLQQAESIEIRKQGKLLMWSLNKGDSRVYSDYNNFYIGSTELSLTVPRKCKVVFFRLPKKEHNIPAQKFLSIIYDDMEVVFNAKYVSEIF